jgi:hypothetical protein
VSHLSQTWANAKEHTHSGGFLAELRAEQLALAGQRCGRLGSLPRAQITDLTEGRVFPPCLTLSKGGPVAIMRRHGADNILVNCCGVVEVPIRIVGFTATRWSQDR